MNPGPDDDPVSDDEPIDELSSRRGASRRGPFLKGILAAFGCALILRMASTLLLARVHPVAVVAAVASLLLSVHMFVGYVGGRVSAHAGLAYENARAQWMMALAVTVLSCGMQPFVERARALIPGLRWISNAPRPVMTPAEYLFAFVVALGLVRFGFAMGTYAQARREGRVRDEDETGVD